VPPWGEEKELLEGIIIPKRGRPREPWEMKKNAAVEDILY
jgi:hypothetical protein